MEKPCSLANAFKSLSLPNFGPYAIISNKLTKINFKINKKLDEDLNHTSFEYFFQRTESVRITFKSTDSKNSSKIFWKLQHSNFHLLNIQEDFDEEITKICENHIDSSIKQGLSGIYTNTKSRTSYEIQNLADKNGLNLLIHAVMRNQSEIVDKLLKYDFDIDHEFVLKNHFTAIDKAWEIFTQVSDSDNKCKINKIILSLLNSNSKFPRNFKYEDASKEVQNFVQTCEELHQLIEIKNLDLLKEKLEENPNLCHFYNRNNQSLVAHALTLSDIEIYNMLISYDLSIGLNEIKELDESFEKLKSKVRNLNRKNAKELPCTYLMILIAKSKISNNDRQYRKHSEQIEKAYKLIDEHDGCQKVLKIAAACKGLKVFFDFKHDSTYYFDPTTSNHTLGITYGSGVIEIGAKDLLDEKKKFKVIGVLIHEFCHFAVYMTYMNKFNPYEMGESIDKIRFEEEVREECAKNQDFEELISSVFENYEEHQFDSELIVRPYHIIMHYFKNRTRIAKCKQKYALLFKYAKEIVEPEFDKALSILIKLQDNEQKVNFCDLTNPMKAKILHGKIYFQGVETSIFQIIGNDEEILKLLKSDQIKDILLNRHDFEFGDVCNFNAKYGYIERFFIKSNENQEEKVQDKKFENLEEDYLTKIDNENKITKNFTAIKEEIEMSKFFILTGKAGDGKTTTFEDMSIKLKKIYNQFWVSFIKLRKFRNIFEKINCDKLSNLEDIFKIFCEILFSHLKNDHFDCETNFEVRIFKKLFYDNKVILLLDGVDEICPKLNKCIRKMLKFLKTNTDCKILISTRPQHARQLEDILNTKSFTLKLYDSKSINALIKNICENSKIIISIPLDKILLQLKYFFNCFKNLKNPLMIIIITELFISGKIDLVKNVSDYYEIFKILVDEQMQKIEEKIDFEDRKYFLNFSLLFQALALKFIFEPEQIKDLSIIKKWEIEKKNWTAEKIQRFGFVIVDLDFLETDNRNSIDFIHYTIAEFFVTQYFIENIFNEDKSENEIQKIFNVLKNSILTDNFYNSFLFNFIENSWDSSTKDLNAHFKVLVINELRSIIKSIFNQKDTLSNKLPVLCQFLKKDIQTLRDLWQVQARESFFVKKLFNLNISSHYLLYCYLRSIEKCFGENWNKILNKNIQNLIFDKKTMSSNINDDIKSHKDYIYNETDWYYEKFYKLLLLINETFDKCEKNKFLEILYSIYSSADFDEFNNDICAKLGGKNFEKCFTMIFYMYDTEEKLFVLLLEYAIENIANLNQLVLIENFLKIFCKNDCEKIRKILFNENIVKRIMNRIERIPIIDDNFENFNLKFDTFINLYKKYSNSIEEMQNFFFTAGSIFKLIVPMPESYFPKFLKLMKETFESDIEKLHEYINKSVFLFDSKPLLVIHHLYKLLSGGNEKLLRQSMRKVLFFDMNRSIDHEHIKYLSMNHDIIGNLSEISKLYKKYQQSSEESIYRLRLLNPLAVSCYFLMN